MIWRNQSRNPPEGRKGKGNLVEVGPRHLANM
jgi:hypothetical protein